MVQRLAAPERGPVLRRQVRGDCHQWRPLGSVGAAPGYLVLPVRVMWRVVLAGPSGPAELLVPAEP